MLLGKPMKEFGLRANANLNVEHGKWDIDGPAAGYVRKFDT
jgi:hypothetical protein